MAEERQVCQAFVEAFECGHTSLLAQELGGTSVPPTAPDQWCATSHPSKDVGYMPSCMGCRADRGPVPVSSIPSMSGDASTTNGHQMLAPFLGPLCTRPWGRRRRKWQPSTTHPKSILTHKWKEGRLATKALKEPCQEAFSKELELVKVARQAYFKSH